MTQQLFTDAEELKQFILGGKAIFSVRSLGTGNHFTYRVKRPSGSKHKDAVVRFVELQGSDQVMRYFGNIEEGDRFRFTRKTPSYMRDHPAVIGFSYVWRWIAHRNSIPNTVEIWHEGKCSMCGIRLTHPDSIKSGIGPECRKKLLRHDMQPKRKDADPTKISALPKVPQ